MDSVIIALGLATTLYLGILLIGDLYLLVMHITLADSQLEKERAVLTTTPIPSRIDLPSICIQLPVHNEEAMIAEAMNAACSQEWPLDRLEIQVLDDGSTDNTSVVAAAVASAWGKAGVKVRLHRREDRSEFKAGMLRFGLERTAAQYIAVFDVDYRPEREFLQQLMKILLSDPQLAFVQARVGHRNRDQNWLTRAQATELDMVAGYENAARSWSGLPVAFAGTCGIWRRQAIDSAGGWSGRSLSEDLDLSFRALSLGWKSRLLATVAVAGELPTSFHGLSIQRSRWSTGMSQQFRLRPWRLNKHFPAHKLAVFFLLIQFHAFVRSGLLLVLACVILGEALDAPGTRTVAVSLIAVLVAIITSRSIGAVLAFRVVRRQLNLQSLWDVVLMWLLQAALLPGGAISAVLGLFFRVGTFNRTPK